MAFCHALLLTRGWQHQSTMRQAVTFLKRSPKHSVTQTDKSKAPSCPYTIPKVEIPASEVVETRQKPVGLFSNLYLTKKQECPKFCSYLPMQCPPLVYPLVRPKPSITTQDKPFNLPLPTLHFQRPDFRREVPFAGLLGYRLAMFGAKVGVLAYIIYWMKQAGIWGSNDETSELWAHWATVLRSECPELQTLGGHDVQRAFREHWNEGVFYSFDSLIRACKWLRHKTVEKEHEGYAMMGITPRSRASSMVEPAESSASELPSQDLLDIMVASLEDDFGLRCSAQDTEEEETQHTVPQSEEEESLVTIADICPEPDATTCPD